MRLASIHSPFDFHGHIVEPGDYAMGDSTLALALEQRTVGVISEYHRKGKEYEATGCVLARTGGFSDLLLLTPTIRQLRISHPGLDIEVACHPRYAPILEGVCETIDYPVSADHGNIHDLDESLESGDNLTPLINRFAKDLGIEKLKNRRLQYLLTDAEKDFASCEYPKEESTVRLGVHLQTDAPNRNYPVRQTLEVCAALLRKGVIHEVFLFGSPGSVRPEIGEINQITDTTNPGLSIRQSIAVAATCDALLVPDSIFMHVAGALNIPALVLSAAFDPSVTQAEQTTVQAMKSMATCRFCSWLPNGITDFPPDRQCVQANQCIALAGLSPEIVARNVKSVLEGKQI